MSHADMTAIKNK